MDLYSQRTAVLPLTNPSTRQNCTGHLPTEAELEELCQDNVSEETIRLVHEAKKLAGVRATSDEGGCLAD